MVVGSRAAMTIMHFASACNNHILEFADQATAAERALLIAAVFQVDYQLFEQQGRSN